MMMAGRTTFDICCSTSGTLNLKMLNLKDNRLVLLCLQSILRQLIELLTIYVFTKEKKAVIVS